MDWGGRGARGQWREQSVDPGDQGDAAGADPQEQMTTEGLENEREREKMNAPRKANLAPSIHYKRAGGGTHAHTHNPPPTPTPTHTHTRSK
jgi:hypothetical protein